MNSKAQVAPINNIAVPVKRHCTWKFSLTVIPYRLELLNTDFFSLDGHEGMLQGPTLSVRQVWQVTEQGSHR